MPTRLIALVAALFVALPALAADDGSDMMDKLVNSPRVESWDVQGLGSKPTPFDDATVQGGRAVRVAVPGKSANQWDISARVQIQKPIAKGDTVLVAFWARAEVPMEGQQTANLAGIRIEQTAAPYGAFAQDQTQVGSQWTMIYASGVADQDYRKGALDVTVQLAVGKQTVDLGPIFVLDFGQNYDQTKLPHNKLTSAAPAPGQPTVSLARAEATFAPDIAKLRALLPVAGRLMDDPSVPEVSAYGADQSNRLIDTPELPGGKALSVSVTHASGDPYSVGASTRIVGDIRKGDVVFFAVYARATETSNEGQYGTVSAINVQLNRDPWTVVAGTAAQLPQGAGWKMYYGYGTAPTDIPSGDAVLTAQFGERKQTIEFGPSFVFDLGPGASTAKLPVNMITYPGRETNAPWRAAADARIRQYRMGDLAVTVTDASGHPVPGASVHFAMQRHLYHFGGFAGFDLTSDKSAEGDHARAAFLKTFNFATSPIYWSDWGWADPTMHQHMVDTMAWLQAHGYVFRGHPVIYPREDLTPGYVKVHAGDPAAAKAAILDHVRDVVPVAAKYGACCLDVVNEPEDGQYLPRIAGAGIFDDAYRTAHDAAPNLHLFINDYGEESGGGDNVKKIAAYHKFIDDMLAKGVPLSGIGFQGHFGGELTDPARVVSLIDDFAKYHVPIEITEFDIETGDEQAQADYTRDLLTVAFSEPATDAFVTWAWRDQDHPQQTMFRRDWSLKPNGQAWMQRIYRDWWTDETKATGSDGAAAVHAFYGDYKITVSADGKTAAKDVAFAPGSAPVAVSL